MPATTRLPLVLAVIHVSLAIVACNRGDVDNSHQETQARRARARQVALQRLRDRQTAACDRVGDTLLKCAIQDARANMTPEEMTALDLENTSRAYKSQFMQQCIASEMSQRQVQVFEACLRSPNDCSAFVDCLDRAKPQRGRKK